MGGGESKERNWNMIEQKNTRMLCKLPGMACNTFETHVFWSQHPMDFLLWHKVKNI